MNTEKYWFEKDEYGNVYEVCGVTQAGIGSVICQNCKNCTDKGGGSDLLGPEWIVCSVLAEALEK